MAERMKEEMHQANPQSSDAENKQVCFNAEDGAWYRAQAVICNNGHDWQCKPSGRWTPLGSSDSCKI